MGQFLLIIEALRSHSDTSNSVECLWKSDQPVAKKPLPDNTQYLQATNVQALGEIRTRSPGKQAAADPRLKSCDHLD